MNIDWVWACVVIVVITATICGCFNSYLKHERTLAEQANKAAIELALIKQKQCD